jgi:Protein of unknown function (DUF2844)
MQTGFGLYAARMAGAVFKGRVLMFESNQSRRRVFAHAAAVAACCAAGMLAAAPSANAALGGSPMATPQGASVTTSSPSAPSGTSGTSGTSAMATMRNAITSGASGSSSASGTAYTVRSTTLATGTVVREYVAASGEVFAACWDGPAYPNLSEIFGNDYYQQYVDGARAARATRGVARGPSTVEQGGLVVNAGGHMGHYVGCASLPAQMPPGVTGNDIR